MSAASLSPGMAVTAPRSRRIPAAVLALLLAMPIAAALCWPSASDVWRTGAFVNSDDATRAVQVRDWMAGQGWFDLAAHRLGLPAGLISHWSRVVDVPLAGLIRAFGLVLPPEAAERAARIAFPFALQAGLVAAMGYAARVLAGEGAVVPAGIVTALAGVGLFQFEPGRIHHHAPQIVLLVLVAAATLDALDPARARRAALAGSALALSLAIGLENLPFFAIALAVPPLAWAMSGPPGRDALLWSAGGLAAAGLALFAATVPPSRYGVTAVDAFSAMHLAALLTGAALMAAAALATPRLRSRLSRFAVLAAAAAALGAELWIAFPEGLHGPLAGMDPLLRPFWLDEVREVRPLARLWAEDPGTVAVLMGPMAFGAAAAAVAACRAGHGLARARWLAVLGLVAVGAAGSVWAIRVASSLQPLALLGAAWAIGAGFDRARRCGRAAALWRPALTLALSSSLCWSLAVPPTVEAAAPGPSCTAPSALAPLAALPPGLAFAPIDAGPFLLAHTGLSALAGPYHRNDAGDHAVIEGFLAAPDAARAIVLATGARYLAICRDGAGLMARAAPGGLAAALAAGREPAWLAPVRLAPTPYRVYELR